MIEKLMSLNHFTYKKPFSGSDKGNRFHYIIQMKIDDVPLEGEFEMDDDGAIKKDDDGNPIQKCDKVKNFYVTCWEGEFNSKNTPDEDKKFMKYPFSEEGYEEALAWLNAESGRLT